MQARYFDSSTGRFTQIDPSRIEPNLYLYAQGNPLVYIDPLGTNAIRCGVMGGITAESIITNWLINIGQRGRFGKSSIIITSTIINHLNKQTSTIFYPSSGTTMEERVLASVEIGGGSVLFAAVSVELMMGTLTTAATTGSVAGTAGTTGAIANELCKDGDCANEAKTSYQIGQEGVDQVIKILNDQNIQEEVRIYVNEVGKRANYFARLDLLSKTAIHEVKNVANLSLNQLFMNQATTYKLIAEAAELELHYWLVNSAPPHVVQWLSAMGIIVHTP